MRVLTGVGILLAVGWYLVVAHVYRLDIEVYRIGVQTWLQGGSLYGKLPETQLGISLPFIYPPISAVVLAPLALIPYPLASLLVTAVSLGAIAITLRVIGMPMWCLPLVLFMEPIRQNLGYGQIN